MFCGDYILIDINENVFFKLFFGTAILQNHSEELQETVMKSLLVKLKSGTFL